MDIDMHYYGTFVLARAAGLKPEIAQTIATASQYVDDSTHRAVGAHPGGAFLHAEATAHHPSDLPANLDRDDQLGVWVPFHFMPGGKGSSLEAKLVCAMDSPIAREMVEHHLAMADAPFAVELIGVTAHVYADTFAHYGFSGVSSVLNRVDSAELKVFNRTDAIEGYLSPRIKRFFTKYGRYGGLMNSLREMISGGAETLSGALGHGAAAIYPDEPYLRWSLRYEQEARGCRELEVERNNPATFLLASQKLHSMFQNFATRRKDLSDGTGVSFEVMKKVIEGLLKVEGDPATRIRAWESVVRTGGLLRGTTTQIPAYDRNVWGQQWERMCGLRPVGRIRELELYRFFQAAAVHRTYVLRELLPSHAIVMV